MTDMFLNYDKRPIHQIVIQVHG